MVEPCHAAKAITSCVPPPKWGTEYTSGPPGPDMPGDVVSNGAVRDSSVQGPEGPAQLAQPMA